MAKLTHEIAESTGGRYRLKRSATGIRIVRAGERTFRLTPAAYVRRYEAGELRNARVRFVPPVPGNEKPGYFLVTYSR